MRSELSCNRIGAFLAFALVASFASLPTSAADTTLVVGKSVATSDPIMAVNVGAEEGLFKKHGLELKIIDFTGGSKMAQGMAAGSIDIADGAGTEMALEAKGVPMLAVCESSGTFPFLALGVPWDSPIKTLAQLKGKKIGVSSPGSLTDWLTHELSRKEGWGDEGVTPVAVGGGTNSAVASLSQHLVDAYLGGTSLFLDLQEKKEGRLLAPVTDWEGTAASGMIFASNRLLASNPDAVRAFVAGWIDSVDFIRTHKAETVKIESGVTGFPENVMSKEYDITLSMFHPDCRFDAESLDALKRSFLDLKLLSTPPDMSKLYTEAYLPKR
jgi:NitT/TauT family transport system substrate-binding protein